MSGSHPAVAHIRRLQTIDARWRADHPELALRGAFLDLITASAAQYYAGHAVSDDLARIDATVAMLACERQEGLDGELAQRSLQCLRQLAARVEPLRDTGGDLDAEDELRAAISSTPPHVILNRDDGEAASDLICWNESVNLLDGVSVPYRCASRVAGLAYWGPADRYRVIDPMLALLDRYESAPSERPDLDIEIRRCAGQFVDWFARDGMAGGWRRTRLRRAGAVNDGRADVPSSLEFRDNPEDAPGE